MQRASASKRMTSRLFVCSERLLWAPTVKQIPQQLLRARQGGPTLEPEAPKNRRGSNQRLVGKLLAAVLLVFLWVHAYAQVTPPCTVSEDSILHEARICGKSREGSLRKSDLTVAGFAIGGSTLEDIAKRFPGSQCYWDKSLNTPLKMCN